MNKMIRTLIALAALAAGSTALHAQPAVKLIVVDMTKVYFGHYKTEEANAKFTANEQAAQEQLEELNKQCQVIVDEYKELVEQSKSTLLTAEARSKLEADGQKKMEDIRRKQAEMEQFRNNTVRSLQQRYKTHHDLLMEEISKVATDIAKQKGATLLIDKSGATALGIATVIYSDAAYDITAEVLVAVNKDRPPPPPPGTTPAAVTPAAMTPGAPKAAPAAPAGSSSSPVPSFTVPNVSAPPAPAKKP